MLLVIGITGASGVIYGIRLLEVLSALKEVETHLIISEAGKQIIENETNWEVKKVKALANACYENDDIGSRLSSGSSRRDGMAIAPCSMRTLAAIANSYADNLITRSADVTLKERKKLVLLPRETPLHLGHLRNMVKATEIGAIIMPPVPAFYTKPETVNDLIDATVGRVLDIFDIPHNLVPRWPGLSLKNK